MSATMEYLQQLNRGDLCLLCHNYGIAVNELANLNRRQLELRLHVAIIEERATMRAYNQLYNTRDAPFRNDRNAWLEQDRLYAATHSYPNRSARNHEGWRFVERFPQVSFRRVLGGDEQENLEPAAHHSGSHEGIVVRSEYEAKLQRQEIDEHPRTYHNWPTSEESQSDFRSCSSYEESVTSIAECPSSECAITQLHKAERITWDAHSTQSFAKDPKPETLLSSEHELCTVHYISAEFIQDYDPLADMSSRTIIPNICDISGDLGDTLHSPSRPQPPFWRHVVEILWFNAQGKLDSDKLRYTLICCAMALCTYMGIKILNK